MKILLNIFLILSIVTPAYIAKAANSTLPDVVVSFYNALKTGNVTLIKNYISGDLYRNTKVLLEQNENYSDFLKKTYRDSNLQVIDVLEQDNGTVIDVSINFPKTGVRIFRLTLKEIESGVWKITQQNEL